MSHDFDLQAPYQPGGDQPQAIAELVEGVKAGKNIKHYLVQQVQVKRLRFQM